MQITETKTQGTCALGIEGDLTIYTAGELKERLLGALGQIKETAGLDLDLSRVGEIDSAGLQVLALCKRESLAQRKELRLVAHSQAVLDLLDLYNLTGYFGDPVIVTDKNKRTAK